MYSYLTKIKKELVKITVAVRNRNKVWHCKQVAIHGVKSDKCWVKDMEYAGFGGGYRVGWHAEGFTKCAPWYEDGQWHDADCKYYNPFSKTVNLEYLDGCPEYRYSAYRYLDWRCVIKYLKIYERYPQTEYLLKLGLLRISDSVTILRRVGKDKRFCKWLIANKDEIAAGRFYIGTILCAYKTGKSLNRVQMLAEYKKRLNGGGDLRLLKEMFGGKLEQFFMYLDAQKSTAASYLDYLKACNYLGLDMSILKNRFPRDFRFWHDIRIGEYRTATAIADEKERAELYARFAAVAQRYLPLQDCKKGGYAVFIAKSPADLTREGDALRHCVGHMNYGQKVIREETLILFVRDREKPDIPFVTVEYSLKNKKVLQCHGDGNAIPNDAVLYYVNKVWLPYANRIVKKISA
jgi:hypothetical protein